MKCNFVGLSTRNTGVVPILLCCASLLFALPLPAQQSSLPCNQVAPWIPSTFSVTEFHDSPGDACWDGDGILCVIPGNNEPANVVDNLLGNHATGEILLNGSLILSVKDNANDYAAGNYVGFVISTEFIELGLFNAFSIKTYLDDVLRDEFSGFDLIGFDLDLFSGEYTLGFVTTLSYDEVEITIEDDLGLGLYNVHYAVMKRFCAGPSLACNVETSMNEPIYPVTIDYTNTGSGGISVGMVDNPENAISASTTDFASLINVASVLGSTFIAVEEQVVNYPAGTFVGFDIENLTFTGVGVLNYITVTSYLDDVQQQQVSGPDLLAGVPLLSGSGRHTVGFVTTTAVDKVKITVSQPAGVTLGTTRVYSAIFQQLCEGPALDCNVQTAVAKPEYPVFIDMEQTGFTGGACVDCIIINEGNVIDNDLASYAQIEITAGAADVGSIAVKEQLTDYPAGTFAGFRIENPNLAVVNALTGITISTYLNGVLQESATNVGPLVSVNSDLLLNDDQAIVGLVTTLTFDEVKISMGNVGMVDVGTTRVYELVMGAFCPAVIECDTTYFPSTPGFPVYINAQRTGVDGVGCVLCTITDEQNVITPDTSDYAEISVAANVIGSASISVADALYTYPPGTFAGFVIEDFGPIIEADLFEYLTISTYNNGVFQESRTGTDLLDVALVILFISADEGRYNVGFQADLPFDEVRITVGSIAAAINYIRVYSSFFDTQLSEGDPLFCALLPVELISFDAKRQGTGALLTWATAHEFNASHFDIQRAGEDKVFLSIGRVAAAGTTTELQQYSFSDPDPLFGMNYYRLQQVDLEGSAALSDIQSLQFGHTAVVMQVWPNPAQNSISVSIDLEFQHCQIALVNVEGETVFRQDVEERLAIHSIDLGGLPPGLYQLIVTIGSQRWSERIVIAE